MTATAMPGSLQPLVQVVITCVMSSGRPPQFSNALAAAATASLGAVSAKTVIRSQ